MSDAFMLEYITSELKRLRSKHRSWFYRLRRTVEFIELADSDYMGWRHRVGMRVGNRDILWLEAFKVATVDEMADLEELRNEKRLGI